jgi:hypothetical protein
VDDAAERRAVVADVTEVEGELAQVSAWTSRPSRGSTTPISVRCSCVERT